MLLGLVVVSCSSTPATSAGSGWATRTSAGLNLDELVAAAKSEGQVNVVGLPPDWARYGFLFDGFRAKYGIKVSNLDPNAISQDEIDLAKRLGRSKNAPDVFDLNMTAALASAKLFAPYKVQQWEAIPDGQKSGDGAWFQDYGGYMAIGYDSAKLPAVAQLDDLLQPSFKGKVALKGDPNVDDTALYAVMMAALDEGGSLDNIAPGVDFFHRLRQKGNFLGIAATNATVKSLQTPVVLDWEFLSRAHSNDIATWQIVVPGVALLGVYFVQAINRSAPHPAAARLWEEYLYSAAGQNEWLKSGARPAEMKAMQRAGTIDPVAAGTLPRVTGTPLFMSPAQAAAARAYLAANWTKAIA